MHNNSDRPTQINWPPSVKTVHNYSNGDIGKEKAKNKSIN